MPDKLARKLLFRFDPETAHRMAIQALKLGGSTGFLPSRPQQSYENLRQTIAGLDFPNPLGIAAGFDKNAEVPEALLGLGFGFAEVGTITPQPQKGNARPRVFRLERDMAVINRFGFNNCGHHKAMINLRKSRSRLKKPGIIGVNIGANKTSPDFVEDYRSGIEFYWPHADYFTVNISSPNTPGLRGLQDEGNLERLLEAIDHSRTMMRRQSEFDPPVFLKIAPDLDEEAITGICDHVKNSGLDGLIVSNTTISRTGLIQDIDEQGGLSGRPLFERSTIVLAKMRAGVGAEFPIIGVGGIDDVQSAWEKLEAGANLLQIYTGMIYHGPQLATKICQGLSNRVARQGYTSVTELSGSKNHAWANRELPE